MHTEPETRIAGGDELPSALRRSTPFPCLKGIVRQPQGGKTAPIDQDRTQPLVLVIDDDPTFLLVMREILDRQGYAVSTARDAHHALAILDDETPDIILTDIMMPEIDGLTLVRELKKRAKTSSIPTLVITALGRSEVGSQVEDSGANGFITKPFSLVQLREAMAPHMKQFSLAF